MPVPLIQVGSNPARILEQGMSDTEGTLKLYDKRGNFVRDFKVTRQNANNVWDQISADMDLSFLTTDGEHVRFKKGTFGGCGFSSS